MSKFSSPPPQPIRVLLVDDSTLLRQGIKTVLTNKGANSGIVVAGEAHTVAEAISQSERLKPDVVLLDLRLPDGSGLTACEEITHQSHSPKVLILTSDISDELISKSIAAGAEGYLMKEIEPAALIDSIQRAAQGATIFPPELAARIIRIMRSSTTRPAVSDNIALLSQQERRVLSLVADGRTNKEIATELSLSDNTVKNYLGSVFEKLQIKRRTQAAAIWVHMKPDAPGHEQGTRKTAFPL